MRGLAIGVLFVAATSVARAADDRWSGVWTVDGKTETREIKKEGALLALSGKFVAGDDRTLTLTGAPSGDRLRLFGRLDANLSVVDKLGGGKKSGRKHQVSIEAELDEAKSRVDAKVTVDGTSHEETWVRGQLVIVGIEVDGAALTGAFDPKLATDGLVVKYRVNNAPLHLTARIEPAKGHPYASFYSGPLLTRDLGVVEPGEHELPWDGRDATSARRIALQGSYAITLEAGTVKADASVSVAAARFEAIASDWSAYGKKNGMKEWNPQKHLDELRGLARPFFVGESASDPGGLHMVTKPEQVVAVARKAASLIIATHGNEDVLTTCDGETRQRYEPGELFGHDLKDVHFVFVSACYSAAGAKGQRTIDKLVGAGCDVAIGFNAEVDIDESEAFEKDLVLRLIRRGSPIEKAARDGAQAFPSDKYVRGTSSAPINQDGVVQVRRAAGIPEDESLWPPRHGCSTN